MFKSVSLSVPLNKQHWRPFSVQISFEKCQWFCSLSTFNLTIKHGIVSKSEYQLIWKTNVLSVWLMVALKLDLLFNVDKGAVTRGLTRCPVATRRTQL